MFQDPNLPPDFAAITEPGEKILWTGKPVFWPFVCHAIPMLIFGLFWGVMDLGILGTAATHTRGQAGPFVFIIGFGILHSFPAWGSIFYSIYLALVHSNTCYAYTNRRLLMRGGLVGTSFKSVDYDTIQDLEVTVGVIERLFNCGTVKAFTGRTNSKGVRLYEQFVSIPEPYAVFRAIKGVEVDVKTDWNYPNALRPATNPGYHTELKTGS